jgi:hypothetical protein
VNVFPILLEALIKIGPHCANAESGFTLSSSLSMIADASKDSTQPPGLRTLKACSKI